MLLWIQLAFGLHLGLMLKVLNQLFLGQNQMEKYVIYRESFVINSSCCWREGPPASFCNTNNDFFKNG